MSDTVEAETHLLSKDWFAHWLRNACLPVWQDRAWDGESGGFIESLTLDGLPEADRPRRFRVQARQVYSFATAARLGLGDTAACRQQVERGLDYIRTRPRTTRGGWGHVLSPSGAFVDDRMDLYDHAFVVLAGASAFQAFANGDALALSREALGLIDTVLRAPDGRGFHDPERGPDLRQANPHMHLLEACLALDAASGEGRALEIAAQIVDLFRTHMQDPQSGAVLETFDAQWKPVAADGSERVEPGHCYEWAVLLGQFEARTGENLGDERAALGRYAEARGLTADGLWAVNAITHGGGRLNPRRRFWPQLERLRWLAGERRETELQRLLDGLRASYVADAGPGLWMDEYDRQDRPCSRRVPASMLYHILTAFETLNEKA